MNGGADRNDWGKRWLIAAALCCGLGLAGAQDAVEPQAMAETPPAPAAPITEAAPSAPAAPPAPVEAPSPADSPSAPVTEAPAPDAAPASAAPTPAAAPATPVETASPAPASTPAPAAPPAAEAASRPARVVPDTGARFADLTVPLKLSPALLRVLLSGASIDRPLPGGGFLRWQQERGGTAVATSYTRQGLPLKETGAWRVDEEGRFCFSLDWLERDPDNWCHLVVKSDEGYFLVGGTEPDDPVQRIYVDGR